MTTKNLKLINNLLKIVNLDVLIKTPICYSHIIQNIKIMYSRNKNHYLSCQKHLKLDYLINHRVISIVVKSGSFEDPPRKKVYSSNRNFDNEVLQKKMSHLENDAHTLRKRCPYLELFWFAIPGFGLNTERYGVSLHIQSECRKIQTRLTPNTDTFYVVTGRSIQHF